MAIKHEEEEETPSSNNNVPTAASTIDARILCRQDGSMSRWESKLLN